MIQSLVLENFESHKKSTLDFSTGLNVFIGESDRGKSGIFRAFKLLTQNKPGGEWMRPLYWEGTTKITGLFSDPNCVVSRVRGKSENVYILNDNEPVSAGTSVPANIAELINMDSVNIQSQIERAFLMFENAGERGRILNKISGLDEIDRTLDNAKKDVLLLTKTKKEKKAAIAGLEIELGEFIDIESIQTLVDSIGRKITRSEKSKNRAISLDKNLVLLKSVENKALLIEKSLEGKDILLSIIDDYKLISAAKSRRNKLASYLKDLTHIESGLKKQDLSGASILANKVSDLMDEVNNSGLRILKLARYITDLQGLGEDISDVELEIEEIKKQLPNTCPECGAKL